MTLLQSFLRLLADLEPLGLTSEDVINLTWHRDRPAELLVQTEAAARLADSVGGLQATTYSAGEWVARFAIPIGTAAVLTGYVHKNEVGTAAAEKVLSLAGITVPVSDPVVVAESAGDQCFPL